MAQNDPTQTAASPVASVSSGTYKATGMSQYDAPFNYTFQIGKNGNGTFTYTWDSGALRQSGKGAVVDGVPHLDEYTSRTDNNPKGETRSRAAGGPIFEQVDKDAAQALHQAVYGPPAAAPAPAQPTQPAHKSTPMAPYDPAATQKWYDSLSPEAKKELDLPPPLPPAATRGDYGTLQQQARQGANPNGIAPGTTGPTQSDSASAFTNKSATRLPDNSIRTSYTAGGWTVQTTFKGNGFQEVATSTDGKYHAGGSGTIGPTGIAKLNDNFTSSPGGGIACPMDKTALTEDAAMSNQMKQEFIQQNPQPPARAPSLGPNH